MAIVEFEVEGKIESAALFGKAAGKRPGRIKRLLFAVLRIARLRK